MSDNRNTPPPVDRYNSDYLGDEMSSALDHELTIVRSNVVAIVRNDGSRQILKRVYWGMVPFDQARMDREMEGYDAGSAIALYWGRQGDSESPFAAFIEEGKFLPYPTASGNPLDPLEEPVNQIPYLNGWTDIHGKTRRGWMADICTFAHEALSWDDRQLQRLHRSSRNQHPDIAHSDDTRTRARLALAYGRILTGYVYSQLATWEELDPLDTTQHRSWRDRMPTIEWLMRSVCEVECDTPHWILDFALNIDADAWEDSLAEQSQLSDSRRVFIPKVLKDSKPWQPGSIGDTNQYFVIFNSALNPLRFFDEQIENFSKATKRYRDQYAVRSHTVSD